MDQKNFIDTVCKKMNLDYSKGNLDAGDDFLKLFDLMDTCDYCLEFTDESAEVSGLKKAIIQVKCPSESKALFDKYGKIIADVAKDLFGTKNGYTICGLECDILTVDEAAAV